MASNLHSPSPQSCRILAAFFNDVNFADDNNAVVTALEEWAAANPAVGQPQLNDLRIGKTNSLFVQEFEMAPNRIVAALLPSLIEWAFAQPWADQIDERSIFHAWYSLVWRTVGDSGTLTNTAMHFSNHAADILGRLPLSKHDRFAKATFEVLESVALPKFEFKARDGQLAIDTYTDIAVGMGIMASAAPYERSPSGEPLGIAWLQVLNNLWDSMTYSQNAHSVARVIESTLPKHACLNALVAAGAYFWVNKDLVSGIERLLPDSETTRALVIPWCDAENLTVPLNTTEQRNFKDLNIGLAEQYCPALYKHMQMLDSDELWLSRAFLRSTAQMLSPDANIETLELPVGYADAAP